MNKFLLIALLWLSLITLFALEPVALRIASDISWEGHWVNTADNCVIVAWEDTSFGDMDILAQKYNASGQAQWQEPAQIVVKQGVQQIHQLLVTSDNNIVVTFGDGGNLEGWQLWAQKISPEGQKLWTEDGVQLDAQDYNSETSYAVANTVGGVYVIIKDSSPLYRIRGFQLDTFGTNMWDTQGLLLFTHSSSVYLRNVVTDFAGGMIIQIDKYDYDIGMSTHLLRISPSGTVVGQNPMIPASTFPGNLFSISVGNTGNYWLTNVEVTATDVMQFQRMDNQGNLLFPGLQNIILGDNVDFETGIVTASTTDGGLVYLWKELTSTITSQLHMQRLDSNLIPMWQQGGVVLDTGLSRQYMPSISVNANNGVWVTWVSTIGTLYADYPIKAQYVSPGGSIAWLEEAYNLSTGEGWKGYPFCMAIGDRAMFIWKDESGTQQSIRRQVLSSSGTAYLDVYGVPCSTHLNGNAFIQNVLALDSGYITMWQDDREPRHNNAYYQIVNNQQITILEENGKALSTGYPGYLYLRETHRINDNKIAALYSIDDLSTTTYYLQVIDGSGEAMYPGYGIVLGEDLWMASLSSEGEDIYIAWIALNTQAADGTLLLKGQRITNGQFMWGADGKTIAMGDFNVYSDYPKVVGKHFLWMQIDNGNFAYSCRALLVDEEGNPAPGWDASGVAMFNPSPSITQQILFAGINEGNLIAFIEMQEQTSQTVYMQKVSAGGQRLWGNEGIPMLNNADQIILRDVNFSNGLSSIYSTIGTTEQLRMQKYDSSGNRLFGDDGLLISTTSSNWFTAKLIKYQNDCYSVLWTDMVNNAHYNTDVFQREISPEGVAGAIQTLCDAPLQQQNLKVAVNGNSAFVAWDDNRAGILTDEKCINSIYGTIIHSNITAITDEVITPGAVIVNHGNYPNPFNPSTTLSFELSGKRVLNLDIYNVKGQKVCSLATNQYFAEGKHSLVWDGRDNNGNTLSSGVYLYKMQTATENVSGKMLMLK